MTRLPDIKIYRLWAALGLLLGLISGAPVPSRAASTSGLTNFHRVAPSIWRGAAPTTRGLQAVRAMGVRTVIDLRIAPRLVRREASQARALGLQFVNLPMGSDPPTPRQVAIFLAILQQAPQRPVFVHCQHGADRTGCMIGIYRETQQGWSFAQAWREMRADGFNPRWTRLTDAVRQRAASRPS